MNWHWWRLLRFVLFLVLRPLRNLGRIPLRHNRARPPRRQRSRRSPAATAGKASSRAGATTPSNWNGLLDRTDVLILDTETTGLGPEAEIIEIAVIDSTGAVLMDAVSLPQDDIPKAVSDIHGLTYRRLKRLGAQPWPTIHEEVQTVLKGASLVLGWNVSFDRRMLQQTAKRHGLGMTKVSWRDLLGDYRTMRPKGRHRLGDAARREHVAGNGNAHRALSDCQTVLAVMRAVVGRQPNRLSR